MQSARIHRNIEKAIPHCSASCRAFAPSQPIGWLDNQLGRFTPPPSHPLSIVFTRLRSVFIVVLPSIPREFYLVAGYFCCTMQAQFLVCALACLNPTCGVRACKARLRDLFCVCFRAAIFDPRYSARKEIFDEK